MMQRKVFGTLLIATVSLALSSACAVKFAPTSQPISDDEDTIEPVANNRGYSDDLIDSEEDAEEEDSRWSTPLKPLAARPKSKEKCRGKGKKRKCQKKDPNPGLSAAHGVRETMSVFRWGMDPKVVLRRLSSDIEAEYKKRQKETQDPNEQDANRKWRQSKIEELTRNHVKFTSSTSHKWGASLIEFEFENDADEEMLWRKTDKNKEFYFFKNQELWKIVVAYNRRGAGNKDYAEFLETELKPKFGVNPQAKSATDPRTKAKLIDYQEWRAMGGEIIRAFDMSDVHGSMVVAVINGEVEKRIGVRLPHASEGEEVKGEVGDVLGGSDVCYDEAGNMIEDAARCKKLRGY